MTWEQHLADLSSQFDAARRRDLGNEAAELAVAEAATRSLGDRWRGAVGRPVIVTVRGGRDWRGIMSDAAEQWLLVTTDSGEVLIPAPAVVVVRGLGVASPPAGRVLSRLGLGHALRTVARAGRRIRVSDDAGERSGMIVRVGADHLDLRLDGGGEIAVAFSALRSVDTP